MKLQDAKALTELLLEETGLTEAGWEFRWTHENRVHGRCVWKDKVIELSTRLTSANTETVVEDTIRHELAHALVGAGHGHGPVWQAKAVALGATPRATCKNGNHVKMVGNLVTVL
jgi:predicted SprT family Zn-dependent metalloprotease